MFTATNINFSYSRHSLWKGNLNFQITSGERVVLKGLNGSGKTTLIKLILGNLAPQTGTVYRAERKSVYLDQDYSLVNNKLKVFEQAQQFNVSALQEHETKIRLNRSWCVISREVDFNNHYSSCKASCRQTLWRGVHFYEIYRSITNKSFKGLANFYSKIEKLVLALSLIRITVTAEIRSVLVWGNHNSIDHPHMRSRQ